MSWYEDLRNKYKPDGRIRIVFLAESPPQSDDDKRRFFYSPVLSQPDNLFRGIMLALLGAERQRLAGRKTLFLDLFRNSGFWLLDSTDEPLNTLRGGDRNAAIRAAIPSLIAQLLSANPKLGVIICSSRVFGIVSDDLQRAGVRVLHDRPIPFPLGNARSAFSTRVRGVLAGVGVKTPLDAYRAEVL
ncbi:MAG: hypothetical protein ACYC53_04815 [Bacillota bacterium]